MLVCYFHEGRNSHYVFKDLQCWTGTHIIHGAIAVLISLVFILICLVISLTFFRSTNKSNNAAARSHSRVDVFILLMKLVLTYMYLFL